MNKQIWRHALPANHSPAILSLPEGATALSVGFHSSTYWLYLLVDPDQAPEPKTFDLYRTEQPVSPGPGVRFIGTIVPPLGTGQDVLHVFERLTNKPVPLGPGPEVEKLVAALKTAYSLIVKHHDVSRKPVDLEWGMFCPVCHHEDGAEPEMDQILAALEPYRK